MEQILQRNFLNNTIQTYLIVIGIILLAVIVKRFVSKYLASLLFNIFSKAGRKFHKDSFMELIIGPLENFLVLVISLIALDKLTFPPLLDFPIHKINSRDAIEALVNATLVITFIRLCIRLVKFIALILEEKANETKDKSDNQLIIFFNDFFRVLLILIGVLLVLKFSFHYPVTNLLTGLSLVGAAIALATKESLENLIASFIIFFDTPFIVGDVVKVQNFTGTVEKIGLRSTRIRTEQKTYITVPNKQMVDTILDNVSMRSQRKAELRLELSLDTNVQQLKEVVAAIKTILVKDGIDAGTVYLSNTGKNAHLISVDYFTSMLLSFDDFNLLKEEVNLQVIQLLTGSNIQFAASSTNVVVQQKE